MTPSCASATKVLGEFAPPGLSAAELGVAVETGGKAEWPPLGPATLAAADLVWPGTGE